MRTVLLPNDFVPTAPVEPDATIRGLADCFPRGRLASGRDAPSGS